MPRHLSPGRFWIILHPVGDLPDLGPRDTQPLLVLVAARPGPARPLPAQVVIADSLQVFLIRMTSLLIFRDPVPSLSLLGTKLPCLLRRDAAGATISKHWWVVINGLPRCPFIVFAPPSGVGPPWLTAQSGGRTYLEGLNSHHAITPADSIYLNDLVPRAGGPHWPPGQKGACCRWLWCFISFQARGLVPTGYIGLRGSPEP